MKKYFFPVLSGLALALPIACATLPVPTQESAALASRMWPDITLENLREGRRLYAANCASCHQLHLPCERTGMAWEKVMARMQPKARLGDGDAELVLRYLTTFSRDSSQEKAQLP